MSKAPSYVIISLVFFIVIGIGFAYSYFFYSSNHPIACYVKSKTGKDCPTCGFSRAFSYYTHGKVESGKAFNALSWPVFLFFSFQFLLRAGVMVYFLKTKKAPHLYFVRTEVLISILWFLLAFLPIILKL